MTRILAIGGGGFLMEDGPSPIDAHMVRLTGKSSPRVCFIPTPSGDLATHLDKFHAAYGALGCTATHLPLFRKPSHNSIKLDDLHDQLLQQDLIFVGGGNTKSALAVWREWGVDKALRDAWQAGTLMAGMSAGALCWFEAGMTDSYGNSEYQSLECLGFLPGTCNVHYNGDLHRRTSLHRAMKNGEFDKAIAIDDHAAVMYIDEEIDHAISWKDGSTAYEVRVTGDGVQETALDARRIDAWAQDNK
jgi:peptidase E